MSKRKIAYARKACIDPEEEGESLPFEPREIVIHKDYWFDRDYELCDELLGRGKFGEVKKCTEKSTGLTLAAKIVNARTESNREDVRKEIHIMAQLRHPKILQIYDAFETRRKMCLITEIVEGGELFDRIVDPHFDLTERVAILFMRQIVDGIAFIHSQNILHLDMKPENIICVAKTGTRIKIIDFGLAMKFDSSSKIIAGTIDFMSPEVCNYENVTPATDMWSIGVICYVLVSGLSPFCGDDDAETICNILRVEFDFAGEEFDEITAGCKDFIKRLLVKDPRKRMSAEDCLKHSWLNKITRSQTKKHLSKKHHIKFFIRRKWKKVIKAVIALNRMKMLVRQRKEKELEPSDNDNSETVKASSPEDIAQDEILPVYLPEWRLRIEARCRERREANRSDTTGVVLSGTARRNRVKSSKTEGASSLTSSLSCSSGYESSGSSKYAPDDDSPISEEEETEEEEDEHEVEEDNKEDMDIKEEAAEDEQIEDDDKGNKELVENQEMLDRQDLEDQELVPDQVEEDQDMKDEECETPTLEKREFMRLESNDTLVDGGQSDDSKDTDYGEVTSSSLESLGPSGCKDIDYGQKLNAGKNLESLKSDSCGAIAQEPQPPGGLEDSNVNETSSPPSISPELEGEHLEYTQETDVEKSDCLEEENSNLGHTDVDVYDGKNGHACDNSATDAEPSRLEGSPDLITRTESLKEDNFEQNPQDNDISSDFLLQEDADVKSGSESQYSSRSSTQLYCPTDTIDNIVSAIARSNLPQNDSNEDDSHASIQSSRRESYASGNSNSSVSGQKPLRRRSSSIILEKGKVDSTDAEDMQASKANIRSRRGSRCGNEPSSDLLSESHDAEAKSYRPRTSIPRGGRRQNSGDDIMTSSFSGVSSCSSDRADQKPPSRLSRYSSNDSVLSTDENRPNRKLWSPRVSPSPAREINTPERRKARIAAICGDDYLPPVPPPESRPHLMERVVPIEVEGSSNLNRDSRWSSANLSRNISTDSDSYPTQYIRSRISQSPLRGDNYYSEIRMPPRQDSNPDLDATEPGYNTPHKRRARIDAIISGNGDNQKASSPTRPPPHTPVGQVAARSAGRTSSDEARHRRIAAVLCNANEFN